MKRNFLFIFLLAFAGLVHAQGDTAIAKGTIGLVSGKGWYRIVLSPEITARLNNGYGNFRIRGADGQEIPYLMRTETRKETEAEIKWLPRIQEQHHERWYSRTIFRNDAPIPLDRLVLKVRNADVNRRFWISGSDDNDHWYIIREDYDYGSFFDSRSTYDLITVSFPPTNYKYFKVEVRHTWNEPIQIMGAGWYDYHTTKGNWQEIAGITVSQADSTQRKQSFVSINLGAKHHVERIIFEVDGPEMYLRHAELQQVVRNADGKISYQPYRSLELSSKKVNELDLGADRASQYRLVIDNKDDRPLKVSGVRAYQLMRYAEAQLDPANAVELRIFPEIAPSPEYDLVHFSADIPADAPLVQVGTISAIPRETKPVPAKVEEDKPLFSNKAWLWVGLVAIVLLVGYMAVRVLKDMDKKE